MTESLLCHPFIKALDTLVSLGVCSKCQDQLEVGDLEYSFEIQPDNFVALEELENLKKQFLADELKIGYYCYDGNPKDVRLAIDLYFKQKTLDQTTDKVDSQ